MSVKVENKQEQQLTFTAEKEFLFSEELGEYVSYGMRIQRDGDTVVYIPDVSCDLPALTSLCERCNLGQPELIHIHDIIEDFLADI